MGSQTLLKSENPIWKNKFKKIQIQIRRRKLVNKERSSTLFLSIRNSHIYTRTTNVVSV